MTSRAQNLHLISTKHARGLSKSVVLKQVPLGSPGEEFRFLGENFLNLFQGRIGLEKLWIKKPKFILTVGSTLCKFVL